MNARTHRQKFSARTLSCFFAIVLAAGLCPSTTAFAATPAEGNTDIGCFEYGYASHAVRTPATIDETFDPALYGETNISFIYVSTEGSDTTGNGSQSAPFATIGKAASVATAGTTIKVSSGVFSISSSIDLPVGVSLEGSRTAGAETRLVSSTLNDASQYSNAAFIRLRSDSANKAYGNQHISYLSLDGGKTCMWAIDVADRHNVSIHDCKITDFYDTGVGWHADDLGHINIEDTNPDVTTVNGTFVTGGRFYNNYLKDNTRFAEGWGRGSLFLSGLEDFHVYNNTIIEDVRTSPTGSRGVPLKVWYYSGYMRDIKIHDNDIQRLGSAMHSSDGSGWDFAIEMAPPFAGLEIANNHFVGSVDLNGGFTRLGDKTYDYAVWIHDNSFTADPNPKYDNGNPFYNEEYAITLERLTRKTIIEYNTITGYDTAVYFNAREEISDFTFRYNLCTQLGAQGGTMFRIDGMASTGFAPNITVKNFAVYNNVFASATGSGRSGFGIILGQRMSCPWSLENVEVSNNVITGYIYPNWFGVENSPTAITGLNLENNIVCGENGVAMPTQNVTGYVNADNTVLSSAAMAAAFGSDWYPAAGSPAIDGGKNVARGLVDLAGHAVPYGSSAPSDPATITRLAGTYANQTSAAISGAAFADGSCEWAIVACDDGFADAMSASGLAGTLGCPILLSNYAELSESTRAEIERLGVQHIYLIGGEYAMTPAVEEALVEIVGEGNVERIWGVYSWDTSLECAKKIGEHGGDDEGSVIIAQSGNFQDALSISPLAYKCGLPIILEQGAANNWELTADAIEFIQRLSGTICVTGGNFAVDPATVEGVFGNERVLRLFGTTGYDTSNVIANYAVERGLLSADTVCIAYGGLDCNGVDALSGAALAGSRGGVMLLVDTWTNPQQVQTVEGTGAFLTANASDVRSCYILGGKFVVPCDFFAHVRDDILQAVGEDPAA